MIPFIGLLGSAYSGKTPFDLKFSHDGILVISAGKMSANLPDGLTDPFKILPNALKPLAPGSPVKIAAFKFGKLISSLKKPNSSGIDVLITTITVSKLSFANFNKFHCAISI